jgi:RNA polymerase sigma-70 factor (ECF subfamily)
MASAVAQELCTAAGLSSPDDAFDRKVNEAITQAKAAWPALVADDVEFARYVGARLPRDLDPIAALAALKVEDLYLAWRCLQRDPAALQAFDSAMAGPIRRALARINAPEALKEDVAQKLRERLFVGAEGQAPRIADFGGRGQLRRWVQAAVARLCLDQVRSQRREVPLDEFGSVRHAPSVDPELEHLRRMYGPVFAVAFAGAIGQLDEEERTMLRHHLVEGLTIDDIGARYGVHRATAYRWVERAREALVEHTRNEMMKRLRIEPHEVESILRVIRSEVHLSVQRLLTQG